MSHWVKHFSFFRPTRTFTRRRGARVAAAACTDGGCQDKRSCDASAIGFAGGAAFGRERQLLIRAAARFCGGDNHNFAAQSLRPSWPGPCPQHGGLGGFRRVVGVARGLFSHPFGRCSGAVATAKGCSCCF